MRLLTVLGFLLGGLYTMQAQNLIVNPGAELNPVGNGWTQVTGFWINGTEVTAHGGFYHFYPGDNSTGGELYQDINVSAWATSIDGNFSTFTFGSWMRIYNASGGIPNDQSRVVVEYRDGGGTVLTSYDSGLRNNLFWVSYSDSRLAPAGTRTIRIRLLATRTVGTAADGYFDDLSLTHNTTLPVSLVSFQALPGNEYITLQWQTASENSNDYFTIEKSENGLEWATIGTVTGSHDSKQVIAYTFSDLRPLSGVQYYRLMQTDFDGTIAYFPVIAAEYQANESGKISFFPNPTTSCITLITGTTGVGILRLYTLTGEEIFSREIQGTVSSVVDLSEILPGIYLLDYADAESHSRQLLHKE